MNQLTTLYDFTLATIERLMADVGEDQMAHQPADSADGPGINPPGWIVGHLALVDEMALGLLGHDEKIAKTLPAAWGAEFGPGSTPEPSGDGYPSKDELMTALRGTHARVVAAVEGVDLAAMTEPNPIAPLANLGLSTTGDLLAHILSTHGAMHVGHLSNWRRQMGFPPLF